MAIIYKGSCVGVLYWDKQKGEWAVHNGRLAAPNKVNTAHLPHSVSVAHWTIANHVNAIPHKEIRHLTGVREVRRTHDLHVSDPRYCAAYRGKPNTVLTIYPGTCFGIYFKDANGRRDVKNGRLLYWVKRHESGHHCVVNRNRIGQISEIVYAHYNIPKGSNNPHIPPKLVPEVRSRGINGETVIDVYRTTLNLSQQP